ncbi:MAG: hydrogenase maturation nickel metallochaperone HypA [Nitrospirae bacterium]|nr:hydrogenase maturation nickel metallochaperone HypA [Nitrospirota bacterium]
MHEVSICESIIDILKQQAAARGKARVTLVRLKIGEMAGVVEDSMRFAFEVVSKDTLAEGAELVIDLVPLMARCKACGADFPIEGYAFSCAVCGSPEIEVVSGRELMIDEIELEEP